MSGAGVSPAMAAPRWRRPIRRPVNPVATVLELTPVFWLLGLLTVAQATALIRVLMRRWPGGVAVNLAAGGLISVGIAQAIAALLNGVLKDVPMTGVRNALSVPVLGWVFGGLAIAAGATLPVNDPRMIRAVARLGLYALLLGALAAVLDWKFQSPYIALFDTPFALLMPDSDVRIFYASAQLYLREETFGDTLLRLVLFFPWTTGLGLGGLGIFFISMAETNWRWRLAGMAGGLVGVVFSWSRVAQVALLVSLALLLVLRLGWRLRLLFASVAGLAAVALPLAGIYPLLKIEQARGAVDSVRAGSSMARELIYLRSWEGFLASPVIGQGWIGPSVHAKEILPIGSHSTVYGTLYTGGLLTFGCFVIAMATLLVALLHRLSATQRGTPDRLAVQIGLALLVCLLVFSPVESLFSLTLPCNFLFAFLGAAIAPRRLAFPVARPVLLPQAGLFHAVPQ